MLVSGLGLLFLGCRLPWNNCDDTLALEIVWCQLYPAAIVCWLHMSSRKATFAGEIDHVANPTAPIVTCGVEDRLRVIFASWDSLLF